MNKIFVSCLLFVALSLVGCSKNEEDVNAELQADDVAQAVDEDKGSTDSAVGPNKTAADAGAVQNAAAPADAQVSPQSAPAPATPADVAQKVEAPATATAASKGADDPLKPVVGASGSQTAPVTPVPAEQAKQTAAPISQAEAAASPVVADIKDAASQPAATTEAGASDMEVVPQGDLPSDTASQVSGDANNVNVGS